MKNKKKKTDWGVYLRPTTMAMKEIDFVEPDTYAIGFGENSDGGIKIIREGRRTLENWSKNYWEVLPK